MIPEEIVQVHRLTNETTPVLVELPDHENVWEAAVFWIRFSLIFNLRTR